jgi:hypothetical protein
MTASHTSTPRPSPGPPYTTLLDASLGWSGQLVYVRVPDRRYQLTSVWLDATDVTRR